MTASRLSPPAIDAAWIRSRLGAELAGQELITVPQSSDCELTVVTPAYNESPRRLITQLLSLLRQDWSDRIESIVVVNNGPDDGTPEWRAAFERNQEVLRLPIFRNTSGGMTGDSVTQQIREGLAVYAIDLSSPGRWTPGNNVGRARQRGLAEAAWRFAQRGRNGVIVHTDCDCRYDDNSFVERVLWLFKFYPDLVCIAGDYSNELVTDDPEAPHGLPDLVRQYKLICRYRGLYDAITKGITTGKRRIMTLGRCIIHRAFEGIAVGGFPPANLAEDVVFGEALEQYATKHGLRFEDGRRWSLGPISALRLSTRTGNDNLSQRLAEASPDGGPPIVDDAFNPGTSVVLDDAYMQRLVAAVRAMPGGKATIEQLFVTSHHAQLRVR
jgi:glycosyltransferase involved in cell wall biosynthesis